MLSCKSLFAAAFLPYYPQSASIVISADITSWSGGNAVEQSQMLIYFDRAQGWHVKESSSTRQRHTWKDNAGCHRGEWSTDFGLAGELDVDHMKCADTDDGLSFLSGSLAANILKLLQAQPDTLFSNTTCKAAAQGFSCKSADGSVLLDVQSGQIQQLLIQYAGSANLQTVQITHTQRAIRSSELTPDFNALGALPGTDTASMTAVFRRALAGDSMALRHAITYLLAVQAPDTLTTSELFRVLEMGYAAKIPGANYASAQLFSKLWRKNLPSEQIKRGEAALKAEFKKRMTEAAKDCFSYALQRMEEGCFELDCENEVPSEATAMLSYTQSQVCETKRLNRFKHLKRPAWANRVLP